MPPLTCDFAVRSTPEQAATLPPRLVDIEGDATDIRCTAWTKRGRTRRLLISLREKSVAARVDGRRMTLAPGKVHVL